MASGIPKRATNLKAKDKRKRAWDKNQEAKAERIAEQNKREAHNREVGSTGKQRAAKAARASKVVEQEDLLEQ